jgi:hypothetical protein
LSACLSACDLLLLLRVSAGWLAAVGVTSARAAGLFRGLEADDDSRDGDDTPDSDFDGIWPVGKTAIFEPFIYKMHYFTKTGSGQT